MCGFCVFVCMVLNIVIDNLVECLMKIKFFEGGEMCLVCVGYSVRLLSFVFAALFEV